VIRKLLQKLENLCFEPEMTLKQITKKEILSAYNFNWNRAFTATSEMLGNSLYGSLLVLSEKEV